MADLYTLGNTILFSTVILFSHYGKFQEDIFQPFSNAL